MYLWWSECEGVGETRPGVDLDVRLLQGLTHLQLGTSCVNSALHGLKHLGIEVGKQETKKPCQETD